MPALFTQPGFTDSSVHIDKDYGYRYPYGMNLRPDSDASKKIVSRIVERAKRGHEVIERKVDKWDDIESNLRCYIPADEEERKVQQDDVRRPVSIVYPVSNAVLETRLTYYVDSLFSKSPIFTFAGRSSEDVYGAALLEHVVKAQELRGKFISGLYKMCRDSEVYGFGVLNPAWETMWGRTSRAQDVTVADPLTGMPIVVGRETVVTEDIVWEGHRFDTIDPRLFLPDPNASIDCPQDMEWLGWVWQTTRVKLLGQEKDDTSGRWFNAKYMKHVQGLSSITSGRDDEERETRGDTNSPCDVICMFVNLIPKDWELGDSEYPEKWFFAVGGDSILLSAERLDLNHGMYPLVVCAPDADGHNYLPVSRMEQIYPMSHLINFLLNAHVMNVRKAVNQMFVFNPELVNASDLVNQVGPRWVRTKRGAWNRPLSEAIQQIPISNITQSNIADASYINDIIQRVSGATDSLQGILKGGSERTTATEAGAAQRAALSRLQTTIRLMNAQCLNDLAMIVASQTQQFMTQEMRLKLLGNLPRELHNDFFGTEQIVTPYDVQVAFDVIPGSNSMPVGENVAALSEITKTLMADPMVSQSIMQRMDSFRLFKHLFRGLGVQNIDDYELSPLEQRILQNGVQAQIVPDEVALQQAQAGNIVEA